MTSQIHALADVQSAHIDPNTRIWQFVVILPNARIGADCSICSHVFIENDVIIGPNVTFTNDPFPRSKQYPPTFAVTTVKAGASMGGGSDHPPGHNDRPRRYGGRRCGGDEVGTGLRGGSRQPGARHSNPRGQR